MPVYELPRVGVLMPMRIFPVAGRCAQFDTKAMSVLPVDAVLFFRFAMALTVVDVKIRTGGEERMAEIGARDARIEVAVGHVRARAVA